MRMRKCERQSIAQMEAARFERNARMEQMWKMLAEKDQELLETNKKLLRKEGEE